MRTFKPIYFFYAIAAILGLCIINIKSVQSALSTRQTLPEFAGIEKWFNSEPVTVNQLRGKVVLVEFWNFASPQSLARVKPLLDWDEKYRYADLSIIAIHSPVYDFEKNPERIEAIIKKLEIFYPVALDTQSVMKNIYQFSAQPVFYLFDAEGKLRETGDIDTSIRKTEIKILELLREIGQEPYERLSAEVKRPRGITFDFGFGYKNLAGFGNPVSPKAETPLLFSKADIKDPDRFYLEGRWRLEKDHAHLLSNQAKLTVMYKGPKVFLVAGSNRELAAPIEIRLDGRPLTKTNKGKNVNLQDGKSYLFITDYQVYEIVRTPKDASSKELTLSFEGSNCDIYAMSFW